MIPYDSMIPNRDSSPSDAEIEANQCRRATSRICWISLGHLGTYTLLKYTKQRFDEVLHELEQERQCADEDLRWLTAAAALLRGLLPHKRSRLTTRRRCTPRY